MVTFKQFLTEYKLNTRILRNDDSFLIIDGLIEQDSKLIKARFQGFQDDPDRNFWIITFTTEHKGLPSSGRTGAGTQFAMKDFVVSSLKMLVAKHDPKGLMFSADKDPDDFGDTRARVYAKIMDKEFKQFKRKPLEQNSDEELFLYTTDQ